MIALHLPRSQPVTDHIDKQSDADPCHEPAQHICRIMDPDIQSGKGDE